MLYWLHGKYMLAEQTTLRFSLEKTLGKFGGSLRLPKWRLENLQWRNEKTQWFSNSSVIFQLNISLTHLKEIFILNQIILSIVSVNMIATLGKFPHLVNCHPENSHPANSSPGEFPPRKFPPRKFPHRIFQPKFYMEKLVPSIFSNFWFGITL